MRKTYMGVVLGIALNITLTSSVMAQTLPSLNGKGQWVGQGGMSLYTYDSDGTSGRSQCTGPCAALWPPYLAEASAKTHGDFSVIARPDRSLQWAYRGHPLYCYAGDATAGMANGDGMNGTWHIARQP